VIGTRSKSSASLPVAATKTPGAMSADYPHPV
jgi:hypothetical protein